jgi:glyoxylase-like metal-dependent hydrolase (beta-lactamase superfamily II)
MIDIKTIQCNMLQENCFIVSDETGEAVIIDCGAYFDEERTAIVDYLRSHRLSPRHLLCTHGHFDHTFGNDTIFDAFGLKPQIHADDAFLIKDLDQQYRSMMGMSYDRPTPPIGQLLADGDVVSFGQHRLKVIHTPGHSPGSVVFYCEEEKVLFSGDTLFRMSVGRTDLPGGSWTQLMESLDKLVLLPGDVKVYTGHGPSTLMSEEKRMNPYFT